VRDLTLAELQRLDAGFGFVAPDGSRPHRGRGIRVPTLDALLAAHRDVPLNIEVKQATPPIVERVLAVLDRHAARARTLLAAEHQDIMDHIRAAAPDVVTSFTALEVADFVPRVATGDFGGYRAPGMALQVPPRFGDVEIVTAESVAAAHALGLEMHVWTINDAAEMARLLALGVDAIMSDAPAIAVPVYRTLGLR
jgi:glycerophosphoryl diester phosphodiesterase